MSGDCLNILTRMLVASPTDRLSMELIKTHPWFLAGLPPGALDMNEFLLRGMEPLNLSMVGLLSGQALCLASDCCSLSSQAQDGLPGQARTCSKLQMVTCMSCCKLASYRAPCLPDVNRLPTY